ncbi:MAG TPA: hypothetical protein VMT10_10670 [Solirubrobacteraceae bacterium]|nr:hypothetical protein [Solirubrobacteraceae bacterium]
MSVTTAPASAAGRERAIRVGLGALGVSSLAIAAFQALDPASFVRHVGPFGTASGHYLRDLATWYAAYGVCLLLAIGRPRWRMPVLAVGIAEGALHLVNHIADAGSADPVSTGIADAVLLAGVLAVTIWLAVAAHQAEHTR